MKILSIIAAVLFSVTVSISSNEEAPRSKTKTISGQVIDKVTGEVLAGVKIQLDKSDNVVYTDFDGNFEIKNIVPGDHKIKSTLISYSDTSIIVDCMSTNTVEIALVNSN